MSDDEKKVANAVSIIVKLFKKRLDGMSQEEKEIAVGISMRVIKLKILSEI